MKKVSSIFFFIFLTPISYNNYMHFYTIYVYKYVVYKNNNVNNFVYNTFIKYTF